MRKALEVGGGAIVSFLADLDPVFTTLVGLMCIDIATGFLAGIVEKKLNSNVSWKGMSKKAVALLVVAVAVIVEATWVLPISLGVWVAGYYCIHELVSITENTGRAGVPFPKQFTDVIEKLQKK